MKADSRLINKESKIAKEKVYQFVLADNTVEDIKSMSLKKAVKSFQTVSYTHLTLPTICSV